MPLRTELQELRQWSRYVSKANSLLDLLLVVRLFLHGEGRIIFDVGPSEPDRYEQHLIYHIVRVYN